MLKYRITESDIRQMVFESCIRILKEDSETNGDRIDDNLVFDLRDTEFSTADQKLNYLVKNLTAIRRTAQAAGVVLSWEVQDDGNGFIVRVYCDVPEIKIEGLKFVGEVCPISDDFAIVAPSLEFKDDIEVIEQIKKTALRSVCARCNRARERGIYYIFMDTETHELKKYGSTCASKEFGINLSDAMAKILKGLAALGREYNTWGDGNGGGANFIVPKDDYPIISDACMYVAMYGAPERGVKYDPNWERIKKAGYLLNSSRDRNEALEKLQNDFPEYVSKLRDGARLESEFYANVGKFADELVPESPFAQKIQEWGKFLKGGKLMAKERAMLGTGVLPYVVFEYFKSKDKTEYNQIEPFAGEKIFNVTIKDIVRRTSFQYGDEYYLVFAITDNNEKITWIEDTEPNDFRRGYNLTIAGLYASRYRDGSTALKKVHQVEADANNPQQILTYPENGTQLRNIEATVVRANERYIILKTDDGCQYFVTNQNHSGNWRGVYAVGTKYEDWETRFAAGKRVIVVYGRVESYLNNSGKEVHALKNVRFEQ